MRFIWMTMVGGFLPLNNVGFYSAPLSSTKARKGGGYDHQNGKKREATFPKDEQGEGRVAFGYSTG